MDSKEIRKRFLTFFRERGHEIVESSSLVPKDDPTLLFTNAGMVQFKALFLGDEKRSYKKAATSQKCVRAGGKHNDLENVGYTPRHHTFFEMLGNFSFGDYFKEEAISWAWELLTDSYGLPAEKLYVSVYKDDDEAFKIWEEKIRIPAHKIVRLGEKDNFWAMGDTGPCGPCSEIFFDQGPSVGCGSDDCGPDCDCSRFIEIWNLVFTQFDRSPDGTLTPLPEPNIDTGMGLERLTAVIQGKTSNYDTDIFQQIISEIENLSGKKYRDNDKQDVAFRVISDHSRSITFLIADGVMPSNEGRGYVLRRIIRRAIRYGQNLGFKDSFLFEVCSRVMDIMGPDYHELERSRNFIIGLVRNEEKRFSETLHYSMKMLNEEIARLKDNGFDTIPGDIVFRLYDTYGLASDIVRDVARDENLHVDMDGYEAAMARQKSQSQESWKGSGEESVPEVYRSLSGNGSEFTGYASLSGKSGIIAIICDGKEIDSLSVGSDAEIMVNATPFYGKSGGQLGDTGSIFKDDALFEVRDTIKLGNNLLVHQGTCISGHFSKGDMVSLQVDAINRKATACNHSATHLLHKALRDALGDHVKQAGSMVSSRRLRFDFSHFAQVDHEQISEIENLVNLYIQANLDVKTLVMSRNEAMKTGAMAIFEEKYGDTVRVVEMGDGISMELCGGTHTERTGDIGLLRIVSESAVAANVRRIEALTGIEALKYDQNQERQLKLAASLLKISPDRVVERIEKLLSEVREKDRDIEALKGKLLARESGDLISEVREIGNVRVLSKDMETASPKELRDAADKIKDRIGSGIVCLGSTSDGKVMLICTVTKDLAGTFKAGEIISQLSGMVGGKGGGRPDMAQGGGNKPEELARALETVYEIVRKKMDGAVTST